MDEALSPFQRPSGSSSRKRHATRHAARPSLRGERRRRPRAEAAARTSTGEGGRARQTAVEANALRGCRPARSAGAEAPETAAMSPAMASKPSGTNGFLAGFRRSTWSQSTFVAGEARYHAEDYRGARDSFSEAVILEPEHDKARALLGWAEYFDGDYPAATITFKTALRRQPGWEGLYDGLGWSRLRAGRPRLAREAFRAALAVEPDMSTRSSAWAQPSSSSSGTRRHCRRSHRATSAEAVVRRRPSPGVGRPSEDRLESLSPRPLRGRAHRVSGRIPGGTRRAPVPHRDGLVLSPTPATRRCAPGLPACPRPPARLGEALDGLRLASR